MRADWQRLKARGNLALRRLQPRATILLITLLLTGCNSSEVPVYTTQFPAFGTAVDLSIVGIQRERAAAAAADIERDLLFFDQALYADNAGRMLRMNERLASGEPFAVPPSLLPLLTQSQALFRLSDGLFNPALGRFTRLWGLDRSNPQSNPPPSQAAIDALLAVQPSMDDLDLKDIELKSGNPAVQLDFDPVSTAYAMDLAIQALRAQSVRSALINIGGNVRAIGSRSGRAWRLPVPRASGTGVIGIVDVSGDVSLFTASSQDRNFVYQGELYHSVIDPRTGRPAEAAASATVLFEGDALTAAAAANALMIAGSEDWPGIAGRMGIRYALLIDRLGRVQMTPAMAGLIELLDTKAEQIIRVPEEDEPRSTP
ncbi:MAG: FAD:protein FMN transferase [Lamprobacter sp.]|uniref:FAD:protein FMN transferase n=1 Tax=Lamprobacter sp. TaxID=3100796 RepID=UPI002B2600D2|nr:FAD:protein FMN transferase [Lamprobacter sp.]MEA3640506.1 FAD:protein FMN transferase [Lamprobacter sp.]